MGHRISRDKRITTHCALVARAFGADSILIDTKDDKIEKSIRSTCNRFGGDFTVKSGVDKKKIIKEWNGKIIHLTMYGEKLDKSLKKFDKKQNLLVIVGAEKVPPYIYEMADLSRCLALLGSGPVQLDRVFAHSKHPIHSGLSAHLS